MSIEQDLKLLIDDLVSDVFTQVSKRINEHKNSSLWTLCLLCGFFVAVAMFLQASEPKTLQRDVHESTSTRSL